HSRAAAYARADADTQHTEFVRSVHVQPLEAHGGANPHQIEYRLLEELARLRTCAIATGALLTIDVLVRVASCYSFRRRCSAASIRKSEAAQRSPFVGRCGRTPRPVDFDPRVYRLYQPNRRCAARYCAAPAGSQD